MNIVAGAYNIYDIGSLVRIDAEFFDAAGNPDDPTLVRVLVLAPSAATATEYQYGRDTEVKTAGAGHYYLEVIPDEAGEWVYRVEGEGEVQAAQENSFVVRPSRIRA